MTIRYDAMSELRTMLEAIDGTGQWTVDLSEPGQVFIGTLPMKERMEKIAAGVGKRDTIQIRDGVEEHRPMFTSTRQPTEAGLEILVEYVGLLSPQQNAVLRVSEIIGCVNLAIGADPSLGGTIVRADMARVEEPAYDPTGRVVGVTIRVAALYQYNAGVTI